MTQSKTPTSSPPRFNALRTWTRDGFLISTDPSLISIPALNRAFDSEDLYWAKGLPESAMREMLDHSLSFGLYSPTPVPPPPVVHEGVDEGGVIPEKTQDPAETLHEIAEHVHINPSSSPSPSPSASPDTPSLIGFARTITDRVTFLYLTDVYIERDWQGQGLGKWLVSCVQEVVRDMPHLRRSMLITGQHGTARESEQRKRFYRDLMGVEEVGGSGSAAALSWRGPGCCF